MSVWDGLTGQDEAVAALRSAAEGPEATGGMTHSWLITGPPGSGRSNVAAAFAAALVGSGADDDHTLQQIAARTHRTSPC